MTICFNGKVLLGGSTKRLSLYREIKQIKQFAADNNCDVLVCNRDSNSSDKGIYHTVVVKESPCLGENYTFAKVFDFTQDNPNNSPYRKIDIRNA